MSTQFTADVLASVPAFEGLSPGDYGSLAQSFEQAVFPAQTTIFRSGEESPKLYVVVDGAVQIAIDVPGGGEAILASLGPRELFGESSFFHPAPHNATAMATSPTTLLSLSRMEYDRLLAAGSAPAGRFSAKAAEILAARLQATDRWVAELLAEEEQQIAASWRRFREGIGGSFELPRGFVHPY